MLWEFYACCRLQHLPLKIIREIRLLGFANPLGEVNGHHEVLLSLMKFERVDRDPYQCAIFRGLSTDADLSTSLDARTWQRATSCGSTHGRTFFVRRRRIDSGRSIESTAAAKRRQQTRERASRVRLVLQTVCIILSFPSLRNICLHFTAISSGFLSFQSIEEY